jgi:DNA-binding NarL/FixJ family response regulator
MATPTESKNRILIVNDFGVEIEGIKSALRDHASCEVVGEAFSVPKTLELVESLKANIVIIYISKPDSNGIEATRQIRRVFPETRVIIYTMFADRNYVIEFFKVGIFGYVLKQGPSFLDLKLAIEAVMAGGSYFSATAQKVLSEYFSGAEEGIRDKNVLKT